MAGGFLNEFHPRTSRLFPFAFNPIGRDVFFRPFSGGCSDAFAGTNGSLASGLRSVRVGRRRWRASAVNMSRRTCARLIAIATLILRLHCG